MLATLAFSAALSLAPAQAGEITLTNPRATYGYLGPMRTDSKVVQGDVYFLMFDIDGLKVGDDGAVTYRMGMALKNSQGKDQFKQEPIEQKATNSLGGSRMPGFAHARIGTDTPPGDYVFEVTVSDPASKREKTLQHKFQVVPKQFSIVQLGLLDPSSQNPTPVSYVGVPGQVVLVSFWLIGFQRDSKTKQPSILAEARMFDDKGKPTLAKPTTVEINKDVPEELQGVPFQFTISLNRAGKFTVQLKATDRLGKKGETAEQKFEINVVEPK